MLLRVVTCLSVARGLVVPRVPPGPRPRARAVAHGPRADTSLRVNYLSDIEDEDAKKKWWDDENSEASNPRDHTGVGEVDSNMGPVDYEGFVDAEGFDGGDGQVGVVGDGSNHMETFDKSQAVEGRRRNAVGGSESKLNAKNAWGTSTGYAEELKKKGMVEYNEYGEDMLQARRQQFENYRNQQELRLQKDSQMAELANLQGKTYQPVAHGAYQSTLETKTGSDAQSQLDKHAVGAEGLVAGEVTATLKCAARLDGRGGATFEIQNEFSQYSDFVAGFVAGSHAAFSVDPPTGTLNRRSGDPQEFVVKFQPTAYADAFDATLVVETDDAKWTYDVVGKLL